MMMPDDPKTDDTLEDEQAEEMEKVQEEGAEERENNGGYQELQLMSAARL